MRDIKNELIVDYPPVHARDHVTNKEIALELRRIWKRIVAVAKRATLERQRHRAQQLVISRNWTTAPRTMYLKKNSRQGMRRHYRG